MKQFTIDSKETKLFNPGIARKVFGKVDPNNPKTLIVDTHTIDYKRQITVYIPAQYAAGSEAPFMVCHDGPKGKADMTLPQPSSYYYSLDSRFNRILDDLDRPPYNVNDPTRKYIIYFDAPVSDTIVCGQGGGYSNLYSSGPSWAIIYLQSTCNLNVGDGNHAAHVVTHELIHSLGAVGPGAPHECAPPNGGHVCDSPLDILYPFLSPNSVFDNEFLDVNRDDYYGNGGQYDIRNSAWLLHLDLPSFALTVATTGTGAGTVTSDAGGINCPGACSSTQVQGSKLTLSAAAGSGSRFAGWSGACTGTGTCVVTFDAAKAVIATFAAQEPLTVSVEASRGSGTVVSQPASISCPGTCTATYDKDQVVKLIANPGTGSRLEVWGGACNGRGDCSVTLSQATTVTATFGPATHRLAASVSGKGKVVSAPGGIACPGRCAFSFQADGVVSLKAVPTKGNKFTGWSGACHGKGSCSVTMTADTAVKATFKKK